MVDAPSRAGHAMVTVAVDDLDGAIAELEHRGIPGTPIATISRASRKSSVADSEGNQITFVPDEPSGD